MMSALYHEEGASLKVEILQDPEITDFIDTHAAILDSSFEETQMSDILRQRLKESDWMFSGMKTFHELNEAFPSLLDDQGKRKPFEQFLNDVRRIDETYNRNYLRAEYNFAQGSAEMAARWEDFGKDEDDYYLQYRTAGDNNVRPEHAALNGVTLPMSDKFWKTYYPPNGWNCRCTVVQVLKERYKATDPEEAMSRGAEVMTNEKTAKMFAFNSGIEQRTFPAYNPYTISRCATCDKTKLNLAAGIPASELCSSCKLIHSIAQKERTEKLTTQDVSAIRKATKEWTDNHLQEVILPNGQTAKRLVLQCQDETLIVNRPFFNETLAKNIRNSRLAKTMELATQIEKWLPSASYIGKETGIHHDFNFLVYEVNWDGIDIEFKVKDQNEKIVYTMRIKK